MSENKKEYRHHFVPQFLIKKFSLEKKNRKNEDEYPIFVYDTVLNKERLDIPRNILYKKFLNSFQIDKIREFVDFYEKEGGNTSDLINMNMTAGYEDAWTRFDNYVSTIYKEIETDYVSIELRALISFFFSGSYIRNTKFIYKLHKYNDLLKESNNENIIDNPTKYIFEEDILNDEELKYLYYQKVFTGKDTFQLFTDFFPVILESDSKFILGDNPVIVLSFYKDYINSIAPKEEGVFALTPISKEKSILLLPSYFIDALLNNFDILRNNHKCIDVTNGLSIDNNTTLKIVDQVIISLLNPKIKSQKFPLVKYKCNNRDIEFLNFLQLANSNRLIIHDRPMKHIFEKYIDQNPVLKDRNKRNKRKYVKVDENLEYEIFKSKPIDCDHLQTDSVFHVYENKIYFNDFKSFYRTIIYKIQQSMRIGFTMIDEKKPKDTLYIKKRHITKP